MSLFIASSGEKYNRRPMCSAKDLHEKIEAFYGKVAADSHHRYRSWEHCYRFFKSRTLEVCTRRDIMEALAGQGWRPVADVQFEPFRSKEVTDDSPHWQRPLRVQRDMTVTRLV